MREDHLLEKGKFPTLLQGLHSSDLIENQNSFSASLERESKMDLGAENSILHFLTLYSLRCLGCKGKQRA